MLTPSARPLNSAIRHAPEFLAGRKVSKVWCDYDLFDESDGTKHAVGHGVSLTVLPDGKASVFMRNAITENGFLNTATHYRWLVARLDGVEAHIFRNRVLFQTGERLMDIDLRRSIKDMMPVSMDTTLKQVDVFLYVRNGHLIMTKRELI